MATFCRSLVSDGYFVVFAGRWSLHPLSNELTAAYGRSGPADISAELQRPMRRIGLTYLCANDGAANYVIAI